MKQRLLPALLVLAVVVMVYLAAQVGMQAEQMSQNAQRIEQMDDEIAGRTPAP